MEKRSERRKMQRKKQLILIAIIIVLIAIISTIIIKTVTSKKSEKVFAEHQTLLENKQADRDTLVVDIEDNNIEENNIIENEIIEEVTNQVEENRTQNSGGTRYRLEVNCTQNVVNVYEKDENGEYTNCIKAMLCSVGPATPTSGTYSLKKYGGWEWKGLFGEVFGQYATQITGNILFHSVPYTEKYNKASLEYWEYDKLGTAASMGCVRLTVQNAKWIYDNCASGTKVMFYQDSNPGPLGKPSEQKISSESYYNNWDPTDPDPENPWRNYSKPQESDKNEIANNNEEKNTISDLPGNNETGNSETENNENNEIENSVAENNEIESIETGNNEAENRAIGNNETKNAEINNNDVKNN